MNEQEIEQEVKAKGLTAPRITPDKIDALIKSASYHVFPYSTHTVCCLYLTNGHTVIGQSACVDPANFDAALGQKIAHADARDKIWALEGYALQVRQHEAKAGSKAERAAIGQQVKQGDLSSASREQSLAVEAAKRRDEAAATQAAKRVDASE